MVAICANEQAGFTSCDPSATLVEFRQLRHQTKNALQRILLQVLEEPSLCRDREGQRIAHDIAHRIELSAAISDALFGFTQSLEPLSARLRSLSESVIDLLTEGTQTIRLKLAIPDSLHLSRGREELVLRIVHELVANAAKHGMHMRLQGCISIRLARAAGGSLVLSVANDGWQMEMPILHGQGLEIVRELAEGEGGDLCVKSDPQQTMVEVRLPRDSVRPSRRADAERVALPEAVRQQPTMAGSKAISP